MRKQTKQADDVEVLDVHGYPYFLDGLLRGLTYITLPSVSYRRVSFPDLNRNPYAGFETDMEKIGADFRGAAQKVLVKGAVKTVALSGSK